MEYLFLYLLLGSGFGFLCYGLVVADLFKNYPMLTEYRECVKDNNKFAYYTFVMCIFAWPIIVPLCVVECPPWKVGFNWRPYSNVKYESILARYIAELKRLKELTEGVNEITDHVGEINTTLH